MKYWYNPDSSKEKEYEQYGTKRRGPQQKLPPFYQFIMCLIRLRLDLPVLLLADLFEISATSFTRITITWVAYMYKTLVPAMLVRPSQAQVRGWMPHEFRDYPNTRVVIDCSEFYIDRPGNKDEQYKSYSSYKSHNTFKCLFGITPCGAFSFVNELWSGNVSDKILTDKCGIIERLDDGDDVMADRGFQIGDLLLKHSGKLIAPPFTRQSSYGKGKGKGKRLNVSEIRKTRKIAKVRNHVERAIQRVKCWKILKHQIPHTLKDIASMIVQLVSALCK